MIEKGLSSREVEELLVKYGRNELPDSPPPSNFKLALNQLASPLVYVLLAAGLVTLLMHEYTDAIVIGLAVFINTVLGFFQEKRAGQALRALKDLIHPEAKVIRDGEVKQIDVSMLVPGDLVVLNKGDKIPADGVISFSNRLFITEAMLTGESVPISKKEGDLIYMGTIVNAGQAKFIVEKTGIKTEMGKIAKSIDEFEEDTPLKKQLKRFSKQLSILTLTLVVITFSLGAFFGRPLLEIFETSVALAVCAIPEGLLVGLTVVLAIGMQRILAKKGLVRNLVSAETLGGVTTICADKTGTLTEGNMKVVDLIGSEEDLKFQVVLANDLDDPIVIAAHDWAVENNYKIDHDAFERLDSIPFSSENKFFACLTKSDAKHNMLFVNGAPEVLLEKSTLSEEDKNTIYDQINALTGSGKRVLGFAKKVVPTEIITIKSTDIVRNLEWVGLMAFHDPVRTDVKEALQLTKKAGIKLVIITGDYSRTAISVLNTIGIVPKDSDVITGDELESIPDDELAKRLLGMRDIMLFARTKPEQKMKIVQALKANSEVVAMMGDGVNDAPAINAADIGVVVGEATDVAKEASDLVLLDSSFSTIVLAIEEGRGIFDNLRKMILYLMCDAFVEIVLVLIAIVSGFPIPLTAVQILWINLVSDGFPNLALTIDPKEENIMEKKPRPANENLVALWMQGLIFSVSLIGGFMAFIMFYLAYKDTGDIAFARSVAFATVGVKSLVYVFSVKTLKNPFWKSKVFNNRWLIVAVFAGMALQLTPFTVSVIRNLFEVTQIGYYWYGAFGMAFLLFLLIEGLKGLVHKFDLYTLGKNQ